MAPTAKPGMRRRRAHSHTTSAQTHAILGHLAEAHGFAGETETQRAVVRMALEAMRAWMDDFCRVTYCGAPGEPGSEPALHAEGSDQCAPSSASFERRKQAYLSKQLPAHLAGIAQQLNAAAAQGGMWIAGTR